MAKRNTGTKTSIAGKLEGFEMQLTNEAVVGQ